MKRFSFIPAGAFTSLIVVVAMTFVFSVDLHADPKHNKELPFKEFTGETIDEIRVVIRDIFENPSNPLYQQANNLKAVTKENVVRQELLLTEGEKFDPFLLQESERALRVLRYLRNVSITPYKENGRLILVVSAQDTWTIIPQLSYSSGTGRSRYAGGLAESNLLGYGKRVELLYEKEENLDSIETIIDDDRVWGTRNRLIGGYFDRSDGEQKFFYFGRPFRSLVQQTSWSSEGDYADVIDRLYENGDERYVFREHRNNTSLRYTFSRGEADTNRHRFAMGYDYIDSQFFEATAEDYEDVDVDPDSVDQDPNLLPSNRRFSGPVLNYHKIEPDFISMNYIDRFDRVEDYNLGEDYSVNSHFAPKALGSLDDTYLFSTNFSHGRAFGASSFIRGDTGLASRLDNDGFQNTLVRGELKYFNAMGIFEPYGMYLGRHTLATALSFDYGDRMDLDREFLVGSDNYLRGYEAKTFTGDTRLTFNIEDRIHLVDDVFQLLSVGAATFIDVGGSTFDSVGNLITDDMYANIGAGLRFGFPRSSGGKVFRIDVALPLRDGPDGSGQFEPRIIFSGGQLFGSRLRSETLGPEKASLAVGLDN